MAAADSSDNAGPVEDLLSAAGPTVTDADVATLVERALADGECLQAGDGPLVASTAPFTGRSARDKYLVRDPEHADDIWWQGNQAMEPRDFAELGEDMRRYICGRPVYVQNLTACSDPAQRTRIRVVTERAWHSLFIRHLLRVPERPPPQDIVPEFTVVDFPGFRADPERLRCRSGTVVALSFGKRLALIGGTGYAGEIKKTVFTVLNHLLPARGVMPMHCSANHALGDPSQSAVFFGLSGTGKTTLSSSPDRALIGDDEHGWYDGRLFNIEGGCYAKTHRLSEEGEPAIFRAAHARGSILENVAFDPVAGRLDFDDSSVTENGRCAYPLKAIADASPNAVAGGPKHVVMLACDAYSVLPPLSRLSPDQAVYHFLSGFTAKVAGTERGLTSPSPTFSTCFGAPFLPRPPQVYGGLLRERLENGGANCWLVNTGWLGGGPGRGSRMPLATTRALLAAVLDGEAERAPKRRDPRFGFEVPTELAGVDSSMLDPRAAWADPTAFDAEAARLTGLFLENFKAHADCVGRGILDAAPRAT